MITINNLFNNKIQLKSGITFKHPLSLKINKGKFFSEINSFSSKSFTFTQPKSFTFTQPKSFTFTQPKSFTFTQPKSFTFTQPKSFTFTQPKNFSSDQPKPFTFSQFNFFNNSKLHFIQQRSFCKSNNFSKAIEKIGKVRKEVYYNIEDWVAIFLFLCYVIVIILCFATIAYEFFSTVKEIDKFGIYELTYLSLYFLVLIYTPLIIIALFIIFKNGLEKKRNIKEVGLAKS